MNDTMNLRLRQLYSALGRSVRAGLDGVVVTSKDGPGGRLIELDFAGGMDDADLTNIAQQLIANIACLGDYLKAWCELHGTPCDLKGPAGIYKSNIDIAIIQDLWNLDKHAKVTKGSWSTRFPQLRDVQAWARFKLLPQAGSSSGFSFDPATGKLTTFGDGQKEQVVDGNVVDSTGATIGNLLDIAERAIAAWEAHLTNAGVPIPPR